MGSCLLFYAHILWLLDTHKKLRLLLRLSKKPPRAFQFHLSISLIIRNPPLYVIVRS